MTLTIVRLSVIFAAQRMTIAYLTHFFFQFWETGCKTTYGFFWNTIEGLSSSLQPLQFGENLLESRILPSETTLQLLGNYFLHAVIT